MTRQPTRSYQHDVESKVEPGEVGTSAKKGLGGTRDTAALARGERCSRNGEVAARLDLDDCEHPATPGDYIYLACRAAPATHDYPPTAQPQMPQAEPLRQPSSALGAPPSREVALSRAPHRFSSRNASARR